MTPKLKAELGPYLSKEAAGEELKAYLALIDRHPKRTIDFLVALNMKLGGDVSYLIRMEPNVQSCEQTLTLGQRLMQGFCLAAGECSQADCACRPFCLRLSCSVKARCKIP